MKLADKFTTVRLVFAPVFLLLYMIPVWTGRGAFVSACIMLPLLGFAEFTDFLDGFFARKNNEVSDFGKLYDPFADVVLHLTAFICYTVTGYMPILLFALVFYREFCMLFIRLIAMSKGTAIAARKGGKFKTVLYITAILFCLAAESLVRLGVDLSGAMGGIKLVAGVLFGLGTLMSYVSFVDYLTHFASILGSEKK